MTKPLTVLACAVRSIAILIVLSIAPHAVRAYVIVDQSSGQTGQYTPSQQFTDVPAYTSCGFDDFTINSSVTLGALTAFGRTTGNASSNLGVVAAIYSAPDLTTTPLLSTSGTQSGADLFFDFGGAPLAAGTYWLCTYIIRPNSAGVWMWKLRQGITNSQGMWHNPGGGFGYGTSPVPLGDVLEQADLAFILSGTDSVCGNGVVEGGEQCDAGPDNGTGASCCGTNCQFKPNGSASCDNNVCTRPDTCTNGVCSPGVCAAGSACTVCGGTCSNTGTACKCSF